MIYDVIVVGVGSMGSSAIYHLAKRGLKVLGLEQFGIIHEEGSHSGQTRLIRKAYFEHENYVPLLSRSYDGWRELENESGNQIYWPTGILYMAEGSDPILQGVKKVAKTEDIELIKAKPTDYPDFKIPDGFECWFETNAGYLSIDRAIGSFVKLAKNHGAEIHSNTKVDHWNLEGDQVVVYSGERKFRARKIVFCTGAYLAELVDIRIPLRVTNQYVGWTGANSDFKEEIPCWVISEKEKEGIYYGFPPTELLGPRGMKIGYHRPGDELESDDSAELEKDILKEILTKYFASKAEVVETKSCKYTYSQDEHFILDMMPHYSNQVVVATGFSGHGFKFVPVIGEILADLVEFEKTELPIDFLSLDRFDS